MFDNTVFCIKHVKMNYDDATMFLKVSEVELLPTCAVGSFYFDIPT